MALAQTLTLRDGRTVAFDDVGDPGGTPVLFHHGTPDSRRARHPDDGIAAELGIRLVALDRPGIGGSTLDPRSTLGSIADDAVALADHLGVARWRSLGWSAGALHALALAARHPDRSAGVAVAAGLVPFGAYATPGLLEEADAGRHFVAEEGAALGPAAFAELAAEMLVPIPCDLPLAREVVLEHADPTRRRAFAQEPALVEALAEGIVDAAAHGPGPLQRELEVQVADPDVDWAAVTAPVLLAYGSADRTSPPAFGRWWHEALPHARLEVLEGEGHLLALTRWRWLLEALAPR